MPEQILIQQLEFHGNCGVTEAERIIAQPLAVDITIDYPPSATHRIATTDQLEQAIDYARVAEVITSIGTGQPYHLLETMAEQMIERIFEQFPATRIRLDVKKIHPPVKNIQGSVGIRVDRTQKEQGALRKTEPRQAQFLVDNLDQLPKGHVLDLACGRGRNALYLAEQGFQVTGIDRDQEALNSLMATAKKRNMTNLSVRAIDLESESNRPPDLSTETYDIAIVFLYLHRPIFPSLLKALKPGGLLVYETFLIDNHLQHNHPRRKEFCLQHNELLQLTSGMRVLHYDEGEQQNGTGSERIFTARLLAQKESTRVQA